MFLFFLLLHDRVSNGTEKILERAIYFFLGGVISETTTFLVLHQTATTSISAILRPQYPAVECYAMAALDICRRSSVAGNGRSSWCGSATTKSIVAVDEEFLLNKLENCDRVEQQIELGRVGGEKECQRVVTRAAIIISRARRACGAWVVVVVAQLCRLAFWQAQTRSYRCGENSSAPRPRVIRISPAHFVARVESISFFCDLFLIQLKSVWAALLSRSLCLAVDYKRSPRWLIKLFRPSCGLCWRPIREIATGCVHREFCLNQRIGRRGASLVVIDATRFHYILNSCRCDKTVVYTCCTYRAAILSILTIESILKKNRLTLMYVSTICFLVKLIFSLV